MPHYLELQMVMVLATEAYELLGDDDSNNGTNGNSTGRRKLIGVSTDIVDVEWYSPFGPYPMTQVDWTVHSWVLRSYVESPLFYPLFVEAIKTYPVLCMKLGYCTHCKLKCFN